VDAALSPASRPIPSPPPRAQIFDRVSKGVREAPSKALIGELAAESKDSPAAAFSERRRRRSSFLQRAVQGGRAALYLFHPQPRPAGHGTTPAMGCPAACRLPLATHTHTPRAGLRQSMATFGALVGAAAAGLAYNLSGRNYVATFALSAVPATAALLLVAYAFSGRQAEQEAAQKAAKDAKAAAAAAGGAELGRAEAEEGAGGSEAGGSGPVAAGQLGRWQQQRAGAGGCSSQGCGEEGPGWGLRCSGRRQSQAGSIARRGPAPQASASRRCS
jgi:hypothetical protein